VAAAPVKVATAPRPSWFFLLRVFVPALRADAPAPAFVPVVHAREPADARLRRFSEAQDRLACIQAADPLEVCDLSITGLTTDGSEVCLAPSKVQDT